MPEKCPSVSGAPGYGDWAVGERDVTEDINLIKEKIDGLKEFGIDVGDAIVEISQVDEEDWANEWKNYYKPTKVGEKVVVKPTWEEYEAKEGDLIIELDPGMAFGTGTHEEDTSTSSKDFRCKPW